MFDLNAQVTLPDVGVDVPATITAMGTDLGTGVMAALALGAVLLAAGAVWAWARKGAKQK